MDDKAKAIDEMEKSIAALNTAYGILETKKDDPNTSIGDKAGILDRMAALHDELVAEEIFHNHLLDAKTTVAPPPAGAGSELSTALRKLQEMWAATNDLVRLLDLAAEVGTQLVTHRNELKGRTSPRSDLA